jgi:hypothetical protein
VIFRIQGQSNFQQVVPAVPAVLSPLLFPCFNQGFSSEGQERRYVKAKKQSVAKEAVPVLEEKPAHHPLEPLLNTPAGCRLPTCTRSPRALRSKVNVSLTVILIRK